MIPLRYVAVPPELLEVPEKLGNRMPLERAMAVMMLDPDTCYQPIDIAHFCYRYSPELDKAERKRLVGNVRQSFAEIARLRLNRSNPNLPGREWVALLQGNLHAVAAKMEELRLLMQAQPGVAFALDGENLVKAPAQGLAMEAPPQRHPARFRRRKRSMSTDAGSRAPVPRSPPQTPEGAVTLQEPKDLPAVTPPGGHRSKRFISVFFLSALALFLVGLPSAYGIYFYSLPKIELADITDLGAPDEEAAHFIAKEQRFEVGDRLVFAGVAGTVKAIDRVEVQVGDVVFPAPDLFILGSKMNVDGNYVVYPGSSRRIAGNFWLSHTKSLDAAEPGYLSWFGGWKYAKSSVCYVYEAAAFFALVSHKKIQVEENAEVVIPEGMQLDEFINQSLGEGFSIQCSDREEEVKWVK